MQHWSLPPHGRAGRPPPRSLAALDRSGKSGSSSVVDGGLLDGGPAVLGCRWPPDRTGAIRVRVSAHRLIQDGLPALSGGETEACAGQPELAGCRRVALSPAILTQTSQSARGRLHAEGRTIINRCPSAARGLTAAA